MLLYDGFHVGRGAVTEFYGVSVKYLVVLVSSWEMLLLAVRKSFRSLFLLGGCTGGSTK